MKKFEPDVSKTAVENGRDRMELFRAEYPQTRWVDPHCSYETPPWGPLMHYVHYAGINQDPKLERYSLGPPQSKPCAHKPDEHIRGGTVISDNHPLAGRRDKRGAFRLARWKNTRTTSLPTRTLENIAACAAVGLSFWCESHYSNVLWAVDDEQVGHEVRIDRKLRRSEHQCHYTVRNILEDRVKGTYRPDTQHRRPCTRPVDGIGDWTTPPTMNALWDMLGPLTRDQAIDEYHEQIDRMDGPAPTTGEDPVLTGKALINGPGNPYNQPMPGTKAKTKAARESAAKREAERARKATIAKLTPPRPPSVYDAAGEKPMSRDAARALLLHDPDFLGDITNAALVDLLQDESVAEYHGRIRAELTTERGLTEKVS